MDPEKIEALRNLLFDYQRVELLFGVPITEFQSECVKLLVVEYDIPRSERQKWLRRRVVEPRDNEQDILIESLLIYTATELGVEL